MSEIISAICNTLKAGTPLAFAVIAAHRGSTPRTVGARMLVTADGLLAGTVGGGLLEGKAVYEGRQIAQNGGTLLLEMDLRGTAGQGMDMICGGEASIFISRLLPDADTVALFERIREGLEDGGRFSLLIDRENGELRVRDDAVTQPGRDEACFVVLDGREWLLCPFTGKSLLVIAGGGHVSLPTAQLADMLGFAVTVIDDRAEFADCGRFPQARRVLCIPAFENCFAGLPVCEDSALIIVTRGHAYDQSVLQQALATNAGYVGMIGSKRKRDMIYANLAAAGVSPDAVARTHCPIGLRIGAETPAEIAVSIMAEIVSLRAHSGPGHRKLSI